MSDVKLVPTIVLKKLLISIGCILIMMGIPISVVNIIYIIQGNRIDGFPIEISFLIITFLPFYMLTLFPLIYLEVRKKKRLLNYTLSGAIAPLVIIAMFGLMVALKSMPSFKSDPNDFNTIASQMISGGPPLIDGLKKAIYTSLYWFFAVRKK